ncbi:SDR family NAD(P)-dependent oxidoreductase [Agromyces silvae]|uniref:SDR family NAD(P)-dependent oxidoreductase n=1 Tax=Agromyces silvae TaxID=3388266 RepID=UPI00280B5547|nr:SDR family oxidoreductase [Agromyces protaetiae]
MTGTVAVVTGGSRGIGRAYAERLRELGATVCALDLRPAGDAATEAVAGRGGFHEYAVDLADAAATAVVVDEILATRGPIDTLVCNAGGGVGEMWQNSPLAVDMDALRLAFEVNVATMATVCRAVVPQMVDRRRGKVVTVSSTAAVKVRPDGGYAHYASAKAGVIVYTKALAREVAASGVTANVLIPGAIGTERLLPKMQAMGMSRVVAEIPQQRLGTPEDCAGVLEFLVTPLSDYVTGAVIAVDGGLTA